MRKATIALVDDHPLVREWLTNLINQHDDMEVSGEAGDVAGALTLVAPPAVTPDVMVVDISLTGGSGLDLLKTLRSEYPGMLTLALSMHDEKLYAERAIRAGARGYIMKRESTGKVVEGIRQVLKGKLYVSENMHALFSEKFLDGNPEPEKSPAATLSDREMEVFALLGQGYETRQIAGHLSISMKTVQAYCARIKEKLLLANAAELLREAFRWNETRAD